MGQKTWYPAWRAGPTPVSHASPNCCKCVHKWHFRSELSVLHISFCVVVSMERRKQWLTILKNELSDSPLVSNAAFSFILMGLEKLVELEFECPCNPKWNALFSSAFFVIPAVMAITLMVIIQGCQNYMRISSLVPALVWLILLFLDGQYYTCAKTDWKGRFVIVDKAGPQKWCEPTGDDNVTQKQELMEHSQELFVLSQVIGIALLMFICVGLIVYVIQQSCMQEEVNQDADSYEMT
ncbi:calcium homeostasis modulator protein 6-like [Anguilla anguilla]|uniref:calcium homeostasis modulator protein 6-like n=1 Tax=Anguilla anguilla TaxID=7936 RepID=UPI0015AFF7F2|nr:calcium homeostasis modulator protein 6-like [Anguilla anguilla]